MLYEVITVRADLTVAMGLPKAACADPDNIDFVGSLEVVDIGIPDELVEAASALPDRELIHPSDLARLFPRRPRDAHRITSYNVCYTKLLRCLGQYRLPTHKTRLQEPFFGKRRAG